MVDRGRLIIDDLSFQIVQLQLRLEAKNESHEREFAAATGELEGGISAVRTLTSELVRTIDEATSLVSSSGKDAMLHRNASSVPARLRYCSTLER